MKVSVCVTIFNEKEETVEKLLDALNSQTLKPDEIIIIDARDYHNCSRAEGRNIAIKKAKNEIIAITDAGCTPHKNWLYELTKSFGPTSPRLHGTTTDVVAGGYNMIVKNSFEKAESIFLGVSTKNMNSDFMPSARSMAFTKSIWKKVGGFPENLNDTAEDTVFNINLINSKAKFIVVKDAIVDWQTPESILNFYFKIFNYARGDAQSGIWWHPVKKWKTHNLKILTIFLRYIILFTLAFFGRFDYLFICLFVYLIFTYSKAGVWGIILQFVSDFGCIIGFSHGILQTSLKRN